MAITRAIKRYIEEVSGNRIFLERSAGIDKVRAFTYSLAPITIRQPLIRVGSENDGGYLVPDDLEGINAVISPGVSTEVGFDLEMASRGIDVFMADASVSAPPVRHDRFHFVPKFIDVFEDEYNIRLDTLCAANLQNYGADQILQMDIEGAEYRTLLDLSDVALKRFRIMVIEFHNLDKVFSAFSFELIRAVFLKLMRHHHIVHVHPNNIQPPVRRAGLAIPPIMEFTFYRKDRADVLTNRTPQIPHVFDRPNVTGLRDYALPECWRLR